MRGDNEHGTPAFRRHGVMVLRRAVMPALAAMVLWAPEALAVTVTGAVVDRAGKPVEYANVSAPLLRQGTVTDESGRFTLEALAGPLRLEVTQIGYRRAVIEVNVGRLGAGARGAGGRAGPGHRGRGERLVVRQERQERGRGRAAHGRPDHAGRRRGRVPGAARAARDQRARRGRGALRAGRRSARRR